MEQKNMNIFENDENNVQFQNDPAKLQEPTPVNSSKHNDFEESEMKHSAEQQCDCTEEQKKQTNLMAQILRSLKEFITKHWKIEITSIVLASLFSCIQIYQNCISPDIRVVMNEIYDKYQQDKKEELYQLNDSLSKYPEVKALYATHKRIEFLKIAMGDYPSKIDKISKMRASTKNLREYCIEANNFLEWSAAVNNKTLEVNQFAKTYSEIVIADGDILRMFNDSTMANNAKFGKEYNVRQQKYRDNFQLVLANINDVTSKDYKTKKRFQKIIEKLDDSSIELFNKDFQISYFETMLEWMTIINDIVNVRLRKIELECLDGTYDFTTFESLSILQEHI